MRCRICNNNDATILDPLAQELLCAECAESIQETIGTNWAVDEVTLDIPTPLHFDYRDDDNV